MPTLKNPVKPITKKLKKIARENRGGGGVRGRPPWNVVVGVGWPGLLVRMAQGVVVVCGATLASGDGCWVG
ncbi:MAG: hypothetical protein ABL903_08580 [Methylococcales bacterium]